MEIDTLHSRPNRRRNISNSQTFSDELQAWMEHTKKKTKEGTTEEAAIKSEMDICFPSSIFFDEESEKGGRRDDTSRKMTLKTSCVRQRGRHQRSRAIISVKSIGGVSRRLGKRKKAINRSNQHL